MSGPSNETVAATGSPGQWAAPTRDVLLAVALLAVGLGFLLFASGYVLLQATQVLLSAVAILGLNLLAGYNGQISLGHGAFLAIGGYAAAVLMAKFGVPYWLAVPLAGLASFGIGFLIGFPALRLDLLYLALATFSLAVAVPQLMKNRLVEHWTGGAQGLSIDKPPPWTWLGLDSDQTIYAFALLVAAISFWLVRGLLRGRMGRAIEAIREHPVAAETMGIDTALVKSTTFGLSAMLTGLGGALGAVTTQFISPDSYNFFVSITLLVGSVVGGFRSIYGALCGAAFIVLMPNYAERVSQAAPWAIYGCFLIVVIWVMPDGIAGLVRSAGRKLGAWR